MFVKIFVSLEDFVADKEALTVDRFEGVREGVFVVVGIIVSDGVVESIAVFVGAKESVIATVWVAELDSEIATENDLLRDCDSEKDFVSDIFPDGDIDVLRDSDAELVIVSEAVRDVD